MHEKKRVWRQWTLILIFFVDVHMGLDPPPLSTCVHLSPTPLRVDVINGWPHTCSCSLFSCCIWPYILRFMYLIQPSAKFILSYIDRSNYTTKLLFQEAGLNNLAYEKLDLNDDVYRRILTSNKLTEDKANLFSFSLRQWKRLWYI